MNKEQSNARGVNFCKKINGKVKDVALLIILAIALIFSAWMIFHTDDSRETSAFQPTETEARIMRLLQEIDGVGEVNVMIYDGENGVQNVAVVCEGANDLRVVMNVRSAVATALGTNEKNIRVYLKKE